MNLKIHTKSWDSGVKGKGTVIATKLSINLFLVIVISILIKFVYTLNTLLAPIN